MDPTATLRLIFDHLSDQQYEECHQSCLDLHKWLHKGGSLPTQVPQTIRGQQDIRGFISVTRSVCETFLD